MVLAELGVDSDAKETLNEDGRTVPRRLRNAAWEMQAGGVGYYAKSGFVHVDTGRVRYWNWKPA